MSEKLRERERLAARGRALEAVERATAALEAPARGVQALRVAHELLAGRGESFREMLAQARRELSAVEGVALRLVTAGADVGSTRNARETIETLLAEREIVAQEIARFGERELRLKSAAESLACARSRFAWLRRIVQNAVPSRTARSAATALPAVRAERTSSESLYDRAWAEIAARSSAHDEALKAHAAALWLHRERLVRVERLRRSLPELWRVTPAATAQRFEQILASLAEAHAYAAAVEEKKKWLAARATQLERDLTEAQAEYGCAVTDPAQTFCAQLERVLAALAEPLASCELGPPPARHGEGFDALAAWSQALAGWADGLGAALATLRSDLWASRETLEEALAAGLATGRPATKNRPS